MFTETLVWILLLFSVAGTSMGETVLVKKLWLSTLSLQAGTAIYSVLLWINWEKLQNPIPIIVLAMTWNIVNSFATGTLSVMIDFGRFKTLPKEAYFYGAAAFVLGLITVMLFAKFNNYFE